MNWGILATGSIAASFVADLHTQRERVVAVGSRSAESAAQFAERFGIERHYPSYEALAADPDVEAIYVATPHPFHAQNARLALEHGKHVLVEKPFTLNAREAAEVVDLAKSKGLVVMEAMWTRFLPHMVRLREILAEGRIGTVRSLVADHAQDLPDDPSHRLNAPELGGGALLDLGIYPVSFAWDLFGPPDTIQSVAAFKATGVDAQVATLFGYRTGAIASLLCASDTAGRNIATVHGTAGRIEIDSVWYAPTSFRVYDTGNNVIEEFHSRFAGRGMQFQAIAFADRVRTGIGSSTILPPSETVAIMKSLDIIREQIGLTYPNEKTVSK